MIHYFLGMQLLKFLRKKKLNCLGLDPSINNKYRRLKDRSERSIAKTQNQVIIWNIYLYSTKTLISVTFNWVKRCTIGQNQGTSNGLIIYRMDPKSGIHNSHGIELCHYHKAGYDIIQNVIKHFQWSTAVWLCYTGSKGYFQDRYIHLWIAVWI